MRRLLLLLLLLGVVTPVSLGLGSGEVEVSPQADVSEVNPSSPNPSNPTDGNSAAGGKGGDSAATVPTATDSEPASAKEDEEDPTQGNGKGERKGKGKRSRNARNVHLDKLGAAFIALYVSVYLLGHAQNDRLCHAFCERFHSVLRRQFADLGPALITSSTSEDAQRGPKLMFKDSAALYQCFGSGRRNCTAMLGSLILRSRQDLYQRVMQLFIPEADRLLLEFALDDREELALQGGGGKGDRAGMEPLVLCLCRTRDLKVLQQLHRDLRELARPISDCAFLNKAASESSGGKFGATALLADNTEVVNKVLVDRLAPLLRTQPRALDFIRCIYVTDQNDSDIVGFTTRPKCTLRFDFTMPDSKADWEILEALLDMAFQFVDSLASFSLTSNGKDRSIKSRKKFNEEQLKRELDARREAVQRKKDEKREKEHESLTAEQKAKRDEKEDRRKAKKNQKSRVKVKLAK